MKKLLSIFALQAVMKIAFNLSRLMQKSKVSGEMILKILSLHQLLNLIFQLLSLHLQDLNVLKIELLYQDLLKQSSGVAR